MSAVWYGSIGRTGRSGGNCDAAKDGAEGNESGKPQIDNGRIDRWIRPFVNSSARHAVSSTPTKHLNRNFWNPHPSSLIIDLET